MKKTVFNLLLAIAVVTSFALTSCNNNDNPEPPVTEDYELSGSITDVRTLDASKEYKLVGPLIVEDGGTLNIPAGTTIKAKKGFNNYILVLQGGKINVNGTADAPVTMTADIENAEEGHWGGLIINGKAPLAGGTTGSTEINSAFAYGGDNKNDNSGSIKYLVLGYTGARSSADVEHNGLTLNGVGAGTTISDIYVFKGADDGIEFFGGSVSVKNLLVVNSDDDMFDVTQGWNGTLENCYGVWEKGYSSSESDPRGVEADGNLDGATPDQTGQSDFTIKNMTIDLKLDPSNETSNHMHDVLKIRRGAKANIVNALIKGTGTAKDIIDMTDGKGAGHVDTKISITNALSNQIIGKEINAPEGFDTSNLKIESGNTGCPTNIFSWTKYQF